LTQNEGLNAKAAKGRWLSEALGRHPTPWQSGGRNPKGSVREKKHGETTWEIRFSYRKNMKKNLGKNLGKHKGNI
jgi:hypothetical protein